MFLIDRIRGLFTYINRNIHIDEPFSMKWGCEVRCNNGKLVIGKHLKIESNVHLVSVSGGFLQINDNVFFNRNCIVIARGKTYIGSNTRFGPNVCVYDHDHLFDSDGVYNELKTGKIVIGDNCWIGAGSIILKDTEIGEGSVIGAGSVVKGKIPPHSLITNDRNLEIRKIENRS